MTTADEKTMSSLHAILARELTKRLESGEASSADFQAAAKFLKDNNISSTPQTDDAMEKLRDKVRAGKQKRSARLSEEEKAELGSNVIPFSATGE